MKKISRFVLFTLLLGALAGGAWLIYVDIPAPTRLHVQELDSTKYLR